MCMCMCMRLCRYASMYVQTLINGWRRNRLIVLFIATRWGHSCRPLHLFFLTRTQTRAVTLTLTGTVGVTLTLGVTLNLTFTYGRGRNQLIALFIAMQWGPLRLLPLVFDRLTAGQRVPVLTFGNLRVGWVGLRLGLGLRVRVRFGVRVEKWWSDGFLSSSSSSSTTTTNHTLPVAVQ